MAVAHGGETWVVQMRPLTADEARAKTCTRRRAHACQSSSTWSVSWWRQPSSATRTGDRGFAGHTSVTGDSTQSSTYWDSLLVLLPSTPTFPG
jgi:hypothetical protein